jgi:hypothetical protein
MALPAGKIRKSTNSPFDTDEAWELIEAHASKGTVYVFHLLDKSLKAHMALADEAGTIKETHGGLRSHFGWSAALEHALHDRSDELTILCRTDRAVQAWRNSHSVVVDVGEKGLVTVSDVDILAVYDMMPVSDERYPHRCPICKGKAYVGFLQVSCTSIGCKHFSLL